MEAQLSGLPVVATIHAGIPDVVMDGQTGLLVEEGDSGGMSEAIGDCCRILLVCPAWTAGRCHVEQGFGQADGSQSVPDSGPCDGDDHVFAIMSSCLSIEVISFCLSR